MLRTKNYYRKITQVNQMIIILHHPNVKKKVNFEAKINIPSPYHSILHINTKSKIYMNNKPIKYSTWDIERHRMTTEPNDSLRKKSNLNYLL